MLRYRFCASSRIKDSSEFQRVFAETNYRFSKGPLILLARRTDLGIPRLGLVIRKKNLRRAFQRNLMKRLIRENFRLCQHDLPSLDMVFMTRGDIVGKTKPQLHNDIQWLLGKAASTHD